LDQNDIFFNLKSVDVATLPEQKLREMVKHLQDQMNNRYMYLVGEWANGYRAKSTRDGKFVSRDEVINYLDGSN
jgi:hypothetical protein